MAAVGIIAEFNPFHSGHEFLLNQTRLRAQNDPIVVLMSGNYVQRGEVAIMDKWSRAQAALQSGADLVLELPFASAVQAADRFALGAVTALSQVGVNRLAFGVEDANLNFPYLGKKIAEIPRQHFDFKDYTQTYSTQYNQMVAREVGYEVSQPNAILGLAYAVSNYQLGEPLQLIAVNRIGGGHDASLERSGVVQSASAIRNLIQQQGQTADLAPWLPATERAQLLQQPIYPSWNSLFPFLKYHLETASIAELQTIYQMSEGLEYKLKAEIHLARNFTEFLRQVKSKRYTYSRLRRLCLYTLLNVTPEDVAASEKQPSLCVLGYSKRGRKYLRHLRKHSEVALVSRVDRKRASEGSLQLQVRVDRLFEQLMGVDQNFGRRPIEV